MGDGCGAQPRSTSSTARDVTVAAGRDSYRRASSCCIPLCWRFPQPPGGACDPIDDPWDGSGWPRPRSQPCPLD